MSTRYHVLITEEEDLQVDAEPIVKTTERYSQRVDAIDLAAIIIAVNKGPKKVRADSGVPRKKTEAKP